MARPNLFDFDATLRPTAKKKKVKNQFDLAGPDFGVTTTADAIGERLRAADPTAQMDTMTSPASSVPAPAATKTDGAPPLPDAAPSSLPTTPASVAAPQAAAAPPPGATAASLPTTPAHVAAPREAEAPGVAVDTGVVDDNLAFQQAEAARKAAADAAKQAADEVARQVAADEAKRIADEQAAADAARQAAVDEAAALEARRVRERQERADRERRYNEMRERQRQERAQRESEEALVDDPYAVSADIMAAHGLTETGESATGTTGGEDWRQENAINKPPVRKPVKQPAPADQGAGQGTGSTQQEFDLGELIDDVRVAGTDAGTTADAGVGVSDAIEQRLDAMGEQRLQSDPQLRGNQAGLVKDIVDQAEQAGASTVAGLSMPDVTDVTVRGRQIDPLEQAIGTRITERLNEKDFIDPDADLATLAETQVKDRLRPGKDFLGKSDNLTAAEKAARGRMDDSSLLGGDPQLFRARAKARDRMAESDLLDDDPQLAAAQAEALKRMQGGDILTAPSGLVDAEAAALKRMQSQNLMSDPLSLVDADAAARRRLSSKNLLGTNKYLADAATAAQGRIGTEGVALEGDLVSDAERIIRERLKGGETAVHRSLRANVGQRYKESMEEGLELLNRLGVLRGGDTADVFNELREGYDRQMLDADAMVYDLQSQAIADALGFQGRRDELGLSNEMLQRGAISDLANIAGLENQRLLAEQGLQRGAIEDAAILGGQRAQLNLAEQGLRRDAISDVAQLAGQRGQFDLAEQGLQRGAISDVAGLAAQRGQRELAEHELQRGAISDVAGLSAQQGQRDLAEQGLQRGAISDVAALAAQRDQRGLAEQGLRRQAISDVLPFQQRRDTLGLAEQDIQRGAIADAMGRQGMIDQRELAEAGMLGELRGAATLPARTAQGALQLDTERLQQDVADRTLGRLMTTTQPTQREQFEEGIRQVRAGEGLARRADTRAERELQSRLFGEIPGMPGGVMPPRRTLFGQMSEQDLSAARQAQEQDLFNQQLQRQLARGGDERARRAQEAQLFGTVTDDTLDPLAPQVRRTRGAQMDDFNQALARAGMTGMFEGQETQDFLNQQLQRELARSGDVRARQALEAELFGEVTDDTLDPFAPQTRRTRAAEMDEFNRAVAEAGLTGQYVAPGQRGDAQYTLAGQQVAEALRGSELQRRLQTADVTGRFRSGADTFLTTEQARQNEFNRRMAEAGLTGRYGDQDTMAREQLEDQQLSAALDRRLATADVTGQFDEKDTRQERADQFNRELAQAAATGWYDDQEGVRSRTLQGRTADQDIRNQLIAQILATGEKDLKGRYDPLAVELAHRMNDPSLAGALRSGLGIPESEVSIDNSPNWLPDYGQQTSGQGQVLDFPGQSNVNANQNVRLTDDEWLAQNPIPKGYNERKGKPGKEPHKWVIDNRTREDTDRISEDWVKWDRRNREFAAWDERRRLWREQQQ